jgi:hypothetical protein
MRPSRPACPRRARRRPRKDLERWSPAARAGASAGGRA